MAVAMAKYNLSSQPVAYLWGDEGITCTHTKDIITTNQAGSSAFTSDGEYYYYYYVSDGRVIESETL